MSYPISEIEQLSKRLQEYLADYNTQQHIDIFSNTNPELRGQKIADASTEFMNKSGIELLPQINKVLGKVDALLELEESSIAERIRPVFTKTRESANIIVNPFGYSELSANLMILVGHLSVRLINQPKVFVGHSFHKDDDVIVDKLIQLFELENFKCLTGRPAKPMDIDEKAKQLIDETDGTIVIFTRDKKLENDGWTTSSWLKSEQSFAMGREKPFLSLYEDCLNEDEKKGIQGDYEFVEFNRECLDNSFLKIIPFIREFRQKILTNMSRN